MSNMYSQINRATRNAGAERKITITEVNMTQKFVSGTDTYNRTVQVMFDTLDPVVAIPAQNEIWVIKQYNNEWRLVRRTETGQETVPITSLNAGDRRLEGTGDIFVAGESVTITGNVTINGTDMPQVIPAVPQQIPPGMIAPYAGTVLPAGWEWVDGAFYDGTNPTYTPLWLALGTTHGGTGQSHFAVPDARGRGLIGLGPNADVNTLGANDGITAASRTYKHYHILGTLAISASGSHTHTFTGTAGTTGAGTAHSHASGSLAFTGSSVTSGTESANHTHSGNTGGESNSHTHSTPAQSGGPSSGLSNVVQDNGGSSDHNISTSSESAGHTHAFTSGTESATHTHTVTAAGTIGGSTATESSHTHSFTPVGTNATSTHTHLNSDFTGVVGTSAGMADGPAFLVINWIIKL